VKIAFDSQILFERQKTGIGKNSSTIIDYYIRLGLDDIVLNYFKMLDEKKREEIIEHYIGNEKVKINKCKWFHNILYYKINQYIPLPYSFFFRQKVDITQFFNYVIPLGVKGKAVLYVYDMAYKVYPETIEPQALKRLNRDLEKSCKRADHIITISEFSKSEIIKYLDIPKDKVSVIPCAVDHDIYNQVVDKEEESKIKEKYNIGVKYFFYLGTMEPRKNIERLIDAYALLLRGNKEVPYLVISGKNGWNYDNIYKRVMDYGLADQVIFTGYIEPKESVLLLKGAFALIFPSLYEGFGMPVLEAMACGIPVVTSNVTSLPEVVQEAGNLVDPFSVEEISNAMNSLLLNPYKAKELKERGIKRAKEFTWEKSIELLRKVYKQII